MCSKDPASPSSQASACLRKTSAFANCFRNSFRSRFQYRSVTHRFRGAKSPFCLPPTARGPAKPAPPHPSPPN